MTSDNISGVLAVCSWIYGEEPLSHLFQRVASFGYTAIELAGEPSSYSVDELHELLSQYGMTVPFLTASCDWPTDDRDLANPSEEVRARAVDHFKACVDLAGALGTPLIGLLPQACGRYHPLASFESDWNHAVKATSQVAEYANANGVHIAIEALNRYEAFLVTNHRQALDFVEQVGASNVGVLLDTFHMNLEEPSLGDAIELTGSRLYHFHLADSNREGLGRGHLDLRAIFRALEKIDYGANYGLEVTAPGPNPFAAIKDHRSQQFLDRYLQESLSEFSKLTGGSGVVPPIRQA